MKDCKPFNVTGFDIGNKSESDKTVGCIVSNSGNPSSITMPKPVFKKPEDKSKRFSFSFPDPVSEADSEKLFKEQLSLTSLEGQLDLSRLNGINLENEYWDKVKSAADELRKHGGVDVAYKHTDQGVELLPITELSEEELKKKILESINSEMQEEMKAFDKKMQEEINGLKGVCNGE